MKKIISFFMALVLCLLPVVTLAANDDAPKEPVTIHIFHRNDCPHCQALLAFLEELSNDEDYNYMFNIQKYEIFETTENRQLLDKVGLYFKRDITGVPFYVIGDYFFPGFSEDASPAEIKNKIIEQYNNEEYLDVVAGIKSGEIEVETEPKNYTGYIILVITIAIVIFIVINRSHTTYYDDKETIETKDTSDKTTKANKEKSSEVKENPKKQLKAAKETKEDVVEEEDITDAVVTKKKSTKSANTSKASTTKKTTNKKTSTTKKNTKSKKK